MLGELGILLVTVEDREQELVGARCLLYSPESDTEGTCAYDGSIVSRLGGCDGNFRACSHYKQYRKENERKIK